MDGAGAYGALALLCASAALVAAFPASASAGLGAYTHAVLADHPSAFYEFAELRRLGAVVPNLERLRASVERALGSRHVATVGGRRIAVPALVPYDEHR
jgi:hypothetical protein